jgi:hypothetical protein
LDLLSNVSGLFRSGKAIIDCREKYLAELLILMAIDTCHSKREIRRQGRIPTVSLTSFLKTLFGSECCPFLESDEPRLQGMYVRLLCFRKSKAVRFAGKVHGMFNRAGGIACNHMPQYCDLIVPLLVIKDNENLDEVTVTADKMSVLIIQVRNEAWEGITADSLPTRDVASKDFEGELLNPDLDYVSLGLNVNLSAESNVKIFPARDPRQISIAATWLTPPRLSKNENERMALKSLRIL